MTTTKAVCSVIALFFFSTFANSFSLEQEIEEDPLHYTSDLPDDEKWLMFQNPIPSHYPISESSGKIHSPFGISDPLVEGLPLGPWQTIGINRPYDDRLHVVQSTTPDLSELQNELLSIGIEIIDHVPDDSVVISLSEDDSGAEISRVQNLSKVRWAGPMPSAWKVSNSLLEFMQFEDLLLDLDVTPSPTNSLEDHIDLNRMINSLTGTMHESSHCDSHLCQIKSAKPSLIISLASDHRVTRVDPGPVLSIPVSYTHLTLPTIYSV